MEHNREYLHRNLLAIHWYHTNVIINGDPAASSEQEFSAILAELFCLQDKNRLTGPKIC